ncbi:cytochrome c3 family protein [Geomobilimonas luticola]|uniref:Cytochrome c3 family protein n=1 Tax=Geomobilimonas luticola TaxID=1114878 RepID=A0ABS5SF95_9BACT|nr:cytochrome c3 family protein [Geomobilimonas luticola]MBT0654038.1 cytochrome c3 family protein [Geomobilimonas luticola]
MKSRFTMLAVLATLLLTVVTYAKETKDIQFRFNNADPVVFSHDVHLNKYNNNCRICHNAIYNLKQRKSFTMAEMEKTKSCGACHSGIKAFSVASEKDCTRCHKGKPRNVNFKVKGLSEVVFSHDTHIAKTGGKCKSCHNGKVITGKEKNVTMAQMEKGKTCGACHDGKKAFTVAGNCGNCHRGMKPQNVNFKVKGISDVTFSHEIHTGMYSCKDCHTKVFPYKAGAVHNTMADMDKGKSCGACHNGKDAFTSAGSCEKCHNNFKPGTVTFKTDAGEAKFSHEIHTNMYKCADCHTKVFPFKAGIKPTTMVQMEGGASCGACHNNKDAFTVKENCEKCHKM